MENVGTWSNDFALFALFCFLSPIALHFTMCMFFSIWDALEPHPVYNDEIEENIEEYYPDESTNGHRWVIRNTWRTMKK